MGYGDDFNDTTFASKIKKNIQKDKLLLEISLQKRLITQ